MLFTSYLVFINVLCMSLLVLFTCLLIRGNIQITYYPFFLRNKQPADQHEEIQDERVLSDWEIENLRDAQAFDARIARMKDEVAQSAPRVAKHGFVAEESDGVINLPHDAITPLRTSLRDEIAD